MDQFLLIFMEKAFLEHDQENDEESFYFVGKEEMEVEEVKDMLDPTKEYNIKPLNPENLILMDIDYNNIKFQYDDYALEGFKRVLVRNLLL